MNYSKTMAFVSATALGLLAFATGGMASATSLYTDSSKTIKYPSFTSTVLIAGTSIKMTSGGSTIAECAGSTISGVTTNEFGSAIQVAIQKLSWSGCSQTTDTIANGELEIGYTSGSSGAVVGRGSEWTFSVFGASCSYGFGAGTSLGSFTGEAAPIIAISTVLQKTAGGFLCPGSVGWDVEYFFFEPHALFVGS